MVRKYSRAVSKKVGKVLKEFEAGKLHSGRGRSVVRKRKQAIAIALSQARKEGKRVPRPKRH